MEWWVIVMLSLSSIALVYDLVRAAASFDPLERAVAMCRPTWAMPRLMVGRIFGVFVFAFILLSCPVSEDLAVYLWIAAVLGGGWLGGHVAVWSGWAIVFGVLGWALGFFSAAYLLFDWPSWNAVGLQFAGLTVGVRIGWGITRRKVEWEIAVRSR